ncbi:GNAT family N-acetyltransferase [Hoyosella sp. YIM 151337]|uniref:GNAT family N-acetyltransferase n=1 Tax=Hoyosella sp. YIM 151337 TaxID=2992742 RepID=UPI00223631E0|nr:GNAT family N-acetyltransferase [Hoyosella sp. YIM 151337]MCW4352209.1 GNAT family N-acetyltransferase [Hoyosella sp. YIM 151337]
MRIHIDGSEGSLTAVGAAVRAIATTAGLREDYATRFRVVVEELVREALSREHEGTVPDIQVAVQSRPAVLTVTVIDQGLPMTGSQARTAPSRRLAALGFVDELHIASHGQEGNVASCAISLTAGKAGLAGTILAENAERVTADEAAAVEIRRMTPDDAEGLVQCIYRCYGYTYKDPALYEPRHIAHLLKHGHMHSVVAVSQERGVVGHAAYFVQREGDPVPEAGKLVVDPRYRGRHLAERMATLRRQIASDEGLPGTWAQAVTNHTGSQREVIQLGGLEVGLLLGASPATVAMAELDNPNDGRRTLLAMYTPLMRRAQVVHLPRHLDALIADLAASAGLERISAESARSPVGHTKLRVMTAPATGVAHIRIERFGADAATRVAEEVDGLGAFDLAVIYLDVPLSDPAAITLAEDTERLGFCFAAWLPDFAPSGDVLRLQRVGSRPIDIQHVQCARSQGQRIRDFTVSEWRRVRRGGLA